MMEKVAGAPKSCCALDLLVESAAGDMLSHRPKIYVAELSSQIDHRSTSTIKDMTNCLCRHYKPCS